MKKNKKKILWWIIPLCMIVIISVIAVCYINDYYRAEDAVLEEIAGGAVIGADQSIQLVVEENQQITLIPKDAKAGIIFYPGGKVQYEAYYPLMKAFAEKGYLCVLLHVTGNLAILDRNAADGLIEKYPEVSRWYLAGHSLGGVVASMYAENHLEDYEGIIFLGSYANSDMRESGLRMLLVYGNEDKVLDLEAYEENRVNLPDYAEHVIDGGCHSYFGAYGMQEGDGNPSISRQKQMEETADYVDDFISECLQRS